MLRTRVLTALVLVSVFGAILFGAPGPAWTVFAAVIAALSAWEWTGLIRVTGPGRIVFASLLGVLVLVIAPSGQVVETNWPSLILFAASAVFWLIVAPLWLKAGWQVPRRWQGLALGVLLLLPPALAMIAIRQQFGPWWLLAIMASVWMADVAAYFVGRRFGRVKLAPRISPGKSREGAYGAIVGVLLYAMIVAFASGALAPEPLAVSVLALACVVHTVVSIVGDLFESLAKRQAGVKDSGAILPGHGGVLDRIDSLLSTLPLVALAAHLPSLVA
ncbi:MAG: phosphatidate cytidylyltransferase [Rhodocyclaceae bacterium]|nr:phosphatidate cytidylyltransferase [Rhodocyclaceae bacterium]